MHICSNDITPINTNDCCDTRRIRGMVQVKRIYKSSRLIIYGGGMAGGKMLLMSTPYGLSEIWNRIVFVDDEMRYTEITSSLKELQGSVALLYEEFASIVKVSGEKNEALLKALEISMSVAQMSNQIVKAVTGKGITTTPVQVMVNRQGTLQRLRLCKLYYAKYQGRPPPCAGWFYKFIIY